MHSKTFSLFPGSWLFLFSHPNIIFSEHGLWRGHINFIPNGVEVLAIWSLSGYKSCPSLPSPRSCCHDFFTERDWDLWEVYFISWKLLLWEFMWWQLYFMWWCPMAIMKCFVTTPYFQRKQSFMKNTSVQVCSLVWGFMALLAQVMGSIFGLAFVIIYAVSSKQRSQPKIRSIILKVVFTRRDFDF